MAVEPESNIAKTERARWLVDAVAAEFRAAPVKTTGIILPMAVGAIVFLGSATSFVRGTLIGISGVLLVLLSALISYFALRLAFRARGRGIRAGIALPRTVLVSLYAIIAGLFILVEPVTPSAEAVIMDSQIRELERLIESKDDPIENEVRNSTQLNPQTEIPRLRAEFEQAQHRELVLRRLIRYCGCWLIVAGVVAICLVEKRLSLALATPVVLMDEFLPRGDA